MFGVYVPIWSTVPFVGPLWVCFVHQTHAMAGKIEYSRRETDERERDEERAAVENVKKARPSKRHCVVVRLISQRVSSQITHFVSI